MKPTEDDRSDLLDELFPASASARLRVGTNDVLEWVHQARAARELRRRRYGVAALIAAPLAIISSIFLFQSPPSSLRERSAAVANPPKPPPAAVTAFTAAAGQQPAVERVDDDHLLGLLDDTPAALVEWPDGRRSLLVVVRNPTN